MSEAKGSFNLSIKIKELPETERPYEKLELYGEKSLSNAELLAIIIKTGTKDETSVEVAQRILKLNYDPQTGELNFLRNISLNELMQIKGIGRVKAIQLKAISELAIRMAQPSNYKKIKVNSTSQIGNMLIHEFKYLKKEYAKLLLLNNRNEILKIENISIGGLTSVSVSIKEIIFKAIKLQASKIILAHNHPTGDPTPSKADIEFTDKLYQATLMFDIELLDHIVLGEQSFKSIFIETKKLIDNKLKK